MSRTKNNFSFIAAFISINNYDIMKNLSLKFNSFTEVDVLNLDIGSVTSEKEKGKKICENNGMTYIEDDDINFKPMEKCVDYLCDYIDNEYEGVKWVIIFQQDIMPDNNDFWFNLENQLISLSDYHDIIGSFGFKYKQDGCVGRGNLLKGIINKPHLGWYKNMPASYHNADYFVVESTAWSAVGVNMDLFKKHIKIDTEIHLNLWGDDISHQFMNADIFNITFPKLTINELSRTTKTNMGFNAYILPKDDKGEKSFIKKYGWKWGYRNFNRKQFDTSKYAGKIQNTLFNLSVKDGPKSIDFFISKKLSQL